MAITQVKKRDGRVVDFDKERIVLALQKAFAAADVDFGSVDFDGLIDSVIEALEREFVEEKPGVEQIQDIVEKTLVAAGVYEVAKRYILYREKRKEARETRRRESNERARQGELLVTKRNGSTEGLDRAKLLASVRRAAAGLEAEISPELILEEALANIYDQVSFFRVEVYLDRLSTFRVHKINEQIPNCLNLIEM